MGNIPKKLKEYEQGLQHQIKESGNNMEQVTSSLCVAVESLGRKKNEDIMSPKGPSKRTRLSSQKKDAKVATGTSFSPIDTILSIAEVGKETIKMIKEL